jgi:hypothetical protein
MPLAHYTNETATRRENMKELMLVALALAVLPLLGRGAANLGRRNADDPLGNDFDYLKSL